MVIQANTEAGTATNSSPLTVPSRPDVGKYPRSATSQIVTNRTLAFSLAEKTQRTIVSTLHLVETPHFLIFSAWNPGNDPSLADVCERMYQMLCQQFSVPANELVWIGKCPIYLFWEPQHYERFISEVDGSRALDANMSHVNGYHASKGAFSYVVINGVAGFGSNQEQAKTRFYHVLVHEGTHAFMHHYVSEQPLPLWVEEGVADFVAATLVPNSEANRTYITASEEAVRKPEMLSRVLTRTQDLTSTEYGLAQSLVRFLVAQNRGAMIQFVALMKRGRSEEVAFTEAYHATEQDFKREWLAYWERAAGRQTRAKTPRTYGTAH
jgi:hypothetical protein